MGERGRSVRERVQAAEAHHADEQGQHDGPASHFEGKADGVPSIFADFVHHTRAATILGLDADVPALAAFGERNFFIAGDGNQTAVRIFVEADALMPA